MSEYRAAILSGPRGPFAVVELTPQLHRRLTPEERRRVVERLRESHRNLPVVFVVASASTLHAIHGVDVTDVVQPCLETPPHGAIPWVRFDHGAAQL